MRYITGKARRSNASPLLSGVETEFKEDKQGLGINKRNKKCFEAQQMMAQLNALAHNLIVWSRCWLAQ